MIRDQLRRAIEALGDRLPGGELVLLVRRAFGDRSVSFIRGDVEEVTGYPVSAFERPTDRWLEIVHPRDRDGVRERLKQLSASESDELRLEYRVVDPEGGTRWIRERLVVRRMAPEAPPEAVGLLRDVTLERTSRTRIARLEKEIWRSRKMEAVGTMTSGIAHDFNNLLTVILASADLLRNDRALSEDSLEDVMVVREAAHRGAQLVQQILHFVAERPGTVETVEMGALVRDLEVILEKIVGPEIRISVQCPDESWPLQADQTHVEQILLNLASNAREAMPGGGALQVAVENVRLDRRIDAEGTALRAGRYVRLTVRDSGVGMTPEIRERAFEPFFSTKEGGEGGGGGFGLSTVRRLVRGYGGGIRVESEKGGGTEFQIYLPVREESEGLARRDLARGTIEEPEPGGARVLLVDADPDVRKVVKRVLERDGHTVVAVGTVAEGLQVFDRVRPVFDVLVTDVVLPDRSGHDLWRAASRRVRDLPVIFMSGYDPETAAEEGVGPDEVHVVPKPLDPRRLREAVRLVSERDDEERGHHRSAEK